jgi:hypothetical protein
LIKWFTEVHLGKLLAQIAAIAQLRVSLAIDVVGEGITTVTTGVIRCLTTTEYRVYLAFSSKTTFVF